MTKMVERRLVASMLAVLVGCRGCSDVRPEPTRTEPPPSIATSTRPVPVGVASTPEEEISAPASSLAKPPSTAMPPSLQGVMVDGAADQILKPGDPPRVSLIAPGQEPRAELRYKLAENKTIVSGMKLELEMRMDVAGKVTPARMPMIGMNMELRTGKRDRKGEGIGVTGEISSVVVLGDAPDAQAKQRLGEAMSKIKGLKVSYVVSDRGEVRDIQVDVSPDLGPTAEQLVDQMKQSFSSTVAPLPQEAVGIGATWQSVARMTPGTDVLQYTTYRLKSVKADKIELETETKQLAAQSHVTLPGAASKARLKSFASNGVGSTLLDLTSAAPAHGDATMTGSMTLDSSDGDVTIETGVRVTFGPRLP
jgi:hypothetical protein